MTPSSRTLYRAALQLADPALSRSPSQGDKGLNIFAFPAYRILKVAPSEHDYQVVAETVKPNRTCPACQSIDTIGFGKKVQHLKDIPIDRKPVLVCIHTRRYRCRLCNRTFFERLPEINGHHAMTNRLVEWIGWQSLKQTFIDVAQLVGVTEGTVRFIFKDFIAHLETILHFAMPTWMGINTIHLIKPRSVIANLRHNTLVNLLPDWDTKTIMDYLSCLPRKDKEQVQYVAIDMWDPYREAVEATLPDAQIIIDRFHIVSMADKALEQVRSMLRKKLTSKQCRSLVHDRSVLLKRKQALTDQERLLIDQNWAAHYPVLAQAYQLKEDFYNLYEKQGQIESVIRSYATWQDAVHGAAPEIKTAFSNLIETWVYWQPYILAYFESPISSVYTESFHDLTRVIDQLNRGHSFEALRAKLLFSSQNNRQNRYKTAAEATVVNATLENSGFKKYGVQESVCKSRCMPRPNTIQPNTILSESAILKTEDKSYSKSIPTQVPAEEERSGSSLSPIGSNIQYEIQKKKCIEPKVAESLQKKYKPDINYGVQVSTLVEQIKSSTL